MEQRDEDHQADDDHCARSSGAATATTAATAPTAAPSPPPREAVAHFLSRLGLSSPRPRAPPAGEASAAPAAAPAPPIATVPSVLSSSVGSTGGALPPPPGMGPAPPGTAAAATTVQQQEQQAPTTTRAIPIGRPRRGPPTRANAAAASPGAAAAGSARSSVAGSASASSSLPRPPVAARTSSSSPPFRPRPFRAHIPLDQAKEALERGALLSVSFRASAQGRGREAYATVPGLGCDLLIRGLLSQNRAVDGDEVAVEVTPVTDWFCNYRERDKLRAAGGGGSGGGRGGGGGGRGRGRGKRAGGNQDASTADAALADDPVEAARQLSEAAKSARDTAGAKAALEPWLARAEAAAAGAEAAALAASSSSTPVPSSKLARLRERAARREAVRCMAELLKARPDVRPTAKVVAILKPSPRRARVVGVLLPAASAGQLVAAGEGGGGGGGGGGGNNRPGGSFSSAAGGNAAFAGDVGLAQERDFLLAGGLGKGSAVLQPLDPRLPRALVPAARVALLPPGLREQARTPPDPAVVLPRTLVVAALAVGGTEGGQQEEKEEGGAGEDGSGGANASSAAWPASLPLPYADVRGAPVGEAGDVEAGTAAILAAEGVRDGPFSPKALACLPSMSPLPWQVTPRDLSERRDLRSWRIFSIDPLTSRDLDDALSVDVLPSSNPARTRLRLGVHIADVSAFVLPGTALDREAQKRGTSTYLVQRVVPMLPRLLCERLCSLNPGEDRFAFSVVWEVELTMPGEDQEEESDGDDDEDDEDDEDARWRREQRRRKAAAARLPGVRILSEWAGRTVIRSCAKLAYPMVQCMIDAATKATGGGGGGDGDDDENGDGGGGEPGPGLDAAVAAFDPREWGARLFTGAEGEDKHDDHEASPSPSLPPAPNGASWPRVVGDCLALWRVARRLRRRRFASGALRLDNTRLGFVLDSSGAPVAASPYLQREANHLVEEFMLLANMRVARLISSAFPADALLRRHGPPSRRGLERWAELAYAAAGVDVSRAAATGDSRAVKEALERLREAVGGRGGGGGGGGEEDQGDAALADTLQLMATKAMELAQYFCTGDEPHPGVGTEPARGGGGGARGGGGGNGGSADAASSGPSSSYRRHYALAVDAYTHFTSPIRRYPDVLVHRLLAAALDMRAEAEQHQQHPQPPPLLPAPSAAAAADNHPSSDDPDTTEEPDSDEYQGVEPPLAASCLKARGLPGPPRMSRLAARANATRLAARDAQDASGRLFLAAMLRDSPVIAEAILTGVGGDQFAQAYVPEFGLEAKLAFSAVDGAAADAAFDRDGGCVRLSRGRERGLGGGSGGGSGGVCFNPPADDGEGGGEEQEDDDGMAAATAAPSGRRQRWGGGRGGGKAAAAKTPNTNPPPIPLGASAALGADFSEAAWLQGLQRGLRNPRRLSPLTYPSTLVQGSRVPVILGAHVSVVSGHLAGVAAKLWTTDCPVSAVEGVPATVDPAAALRAARREGTIKAFGEAKGAPPDLPSSSRGGGAGEEEDEAAAAAGEPPVVSLLSLEGVMDD